MSKLVRMHGHINSCGQMEVSFFHIKPIFGDHRSISELTYKVHFNPKTLTRMGVTWIYLRSTTNILYINSFQIIYFSFTILIIITT